MNVMQRLATLAAGAALVLAVPTVMAQVQWPHAVVGEKIDSGLGGLPPYASWDDKTGRVPVRHRVAGESLDDGLGELPHYSKWIDRTGRDPMRRGTLSAQLSPR